MTTNAIRVARFMLAVTGSAGYTPTHENGLANFGRVDQYCALSMVWVRLFRAKLRQNLASKRVPRPIRSSSMTTIGDT